MQLNINTDATVVFTNKLEKMSRSALPLAIRNTLNSVAFDVKKTTMPQEAQQNFTIRSKNFFKANSRVEMAKGWNIKAMQSTVGFLASSSPGADMAVKDLEEQEHGGSIGGRSYIPTEQARGGSMSRLVRPVNRLRMVKNLKDASKMPGKTQQAKFAAAVKKAGKGGFVLGNTPSRTLWRIEDLKGKKKAVYSYKAHRSVRIKGTHFMQDASVRSAQQIDDIYIEQAKKQIERLTK